MENFVVNSFIFKENNTFRKNFSFSTDKTSEFEIKKELLEKLDINEKWIVEKDEYKLIEKESVIRYNVYLKPSGIEPKKDKK